MRTSLTTTLGLAALAAGIGIVVGRTTMARRAAVELWDRAERSNPTNPTGTAATHARQKADEVAATRREGDPEARGTREGAVGLDLARLQSVSDRLEPVVQYLTYIQSRRGQDSSLLFIRYDDIDAMAELDGEPSQELMERLDQLGVVISSN